MFLAGGVQGNLNMSFRGNLLSGSPRKARWGDQSAADKGVWSRGEDICKSSASRQWLNLGVWVSLSSEREDRKVNLKPVCPAISGRVEGKNSVQGPSKKWLEGAGGGTEEHEIQDVRTGTV